MLWRARPCRRCEGALAAAAAFAFIISFDELDATIFIVGQTDNTLPVSMFIYMEKYQDPTLAALSALLIGAALVLGTGIAVLCSHRRAPRPGRGHEPGRRSRARADPHAHAEEET